MSSPTSRKKILTAYADMLSALFGKSGTVGKYFRAVRRGFLAAKEDMYPVLILQDGGQKKVGEDESIVEHDLSITVYLLLKENWDRIDNADEWTDRVQQIVDSMDKHIEIGCGVIEMKYLDDEPTDVMFSAALAQAGWQINFSCVYITDRAQS